MAKIESKLNLNKTPYAVESNSLIFAKNIRLDIDGSIHRDHGISPLSKCKKINIEIDYNDILSRIIADVESYKTENEDLTKIYNKLVDLNNGTWTIVGVIPYNVEFYLFFNGTDTNNNIINCVIRYDEYNDKFYICNCNWNWSGGTINGQVINNIIGEKLLIIGEQSDNTIVPLKSINLIHSSINDDETLYTQTPNIPISNLYVINTFNYSIPNGVYQFFIRYKIREDFYTNWLPVSKELFVGNSNTEDTSFGSVKYCNTKTDSDFSFVFEIEHLLTENIKNYESFQIGFLCSHDDTTYARAWKHFNFDTSNIYFDYATQDGEEIETSDLVNSIYGLYNVGNLAYFKNKLYISNYIETNYNEELQEYADKINITVSDILMSKTYNGHKIIQANLATIEIYAEGFVINEQYYYFNGYNVENSIFDTLYRKELPNGSIYDRLETILYREDDIHDYDNEDIKNIEIDEVINEYGITLNVTCKSINELLKPIKEEYKDTREYQPNGDIIEYKYNILVPAVTSFMWNDREEIIDGINVSDIYHELRSKIVYLRQDGVFTYTDLKEINNINIELYYSLSIERKITTIKPNGTTNITSNTFSLGLSQNINIIPTGYANKFYIPNNSVFDDIRFQKGNLNTLIPYQKYKFYIHYIKSTGEITNGYYCSKAGEIEAYHKGTTNNIIYPVFKNIEIPKQYVACFFSICHIKNNTSHIVNAEINDDNNIIEGICPDINIGLIQEYENMNIHQNHNNNNNYDDVNTNTGEYFHSTNTTNYKYFGANGVIVYDNNNEFFPGYNYFLVSPWSISEHQNIELIKCTPYINQSNGVKDSDSTFAYSFYNNLNLNGYICEIKNLIKNVCENYYSDGSNAIYKKNINSDNVKQTLELNELSKYNTEDPTNDLINFDIKSSESCYIYSNWNLNYITLSEEIKLNYITVYNKNADDIPSTSTSDTTTTTEILEVEEISENRRREKVQTTETTIEKTIDSTTVTKKITLESIYYNDNKDKKETTNLGEQIITTTTPNKNTEKTIILKVFSSQLMADIYALPSMYKKYLRKTYSIVTENNITKFNNTIRSSNIIQDETKLNILTFDSLDYYNIPTNKGIITNLISVGDNILVHTVDSMFRFSGTNTLQSNNGDIQQLESSPFDTGVTEIFGSDFGFAGLQSKTDCIVNELGYIFFDRDSNVVYMYSGQGQIKKISEDIEKLFNHTSIENIRFANDYYNNRFFLSILFYDYETNTTDNTKNKVYTPVTLSYNISEEHKAFVSLHDFYFKESFNTKTKCYFLTDDKRDICTIDKSIFSKYSKLQLVDKKYPQLLVDETDYSTFMSIVDIIFNNNYETIKTLNAINWCGNNISTEFKTLDKSDVTTLLMAEDTSYKIPCKYIRIYTDTCSTALLDCDDRSNNYSLNSPNSYKLPRYNQGVWTLNYFRNILNSNTDKLYVSDQNSLIEGKYFVVRFVFNKEFKLETLNFNYSNKI